MRLPTLLRLALPLAFVPVFAVASCSSDDQTTATGPAAQKPKAPEPAFWGPDCDPLVPEHCGFPFPSNTALVDDAATPTKKRVAFKAGALPRWKGNVTNPAPWSDSDGFSAGAT